MRWPWQRGATVAAGGKRVAESEGRSDPALAFAQSYCSASGARIRLNGDTLQATFPDGATRRYTTTNRDGDTEAALLVPGSAALAGMLADVESRTGIASLRLPRRSDPEALVRESLVVAPKDCGRCLSIGVGDASASISPCEECPLLADGARFVVNALPRRGALRIVPMETTTSVELTFRVSARDRGGRTDDVVRLAFDAAGQRVEVLSIAHVGATVAEPLTEDVAAMATTAYERAEEALLPAMDAAGAFLRLRSADAYGKRLGDLTATYDSLRREQPENEREVLRSLRRELASLAEVFAVDVQATLESICFVTSPVARVFWRLAGGANLALLVDAGRPTVSAVCASCGARTQCGVITQSGRILCADCLSGTASPTESQATGEEANGRKKSAKGDARALTTQQLAALAQFTPRLWSQCALWLLGAAGYRVQDIGPAATTWRASRDGHPVLVKVLPYPPRKTLAARDVRQLGARAKREGARGLLLTLTSVADGARMVARETGVELLDRSVVDELLAGLATEQASSSTLARSEAKERVAAAIKTRDALLQSLDNAAEALAVAPNGERVVGAASLSAALASLDAVGQSARQAFLAWETLVADWLAVFPERMTPSGGLVIEAEKDGLRALRDRAIHLGKALVSVFERLNHTPTDGELGYGAWRAALVDEYKTQCAALRARIASIDPGEWEDARRARSAEAEAAAERASQEARHAAARAAKAHVAVSQFLGKR